MKPFALLALLPACVPPAPDRADALACDPADTSAHPRAAELDAALADTRESLAIPGLSMAVLDDDGLWLGAAGTADAENDVALAPCMRLPIFSVTKTYVAASVLSLAEDGLLELDEPVDALLSDAEARGIANVEALTPRLLVGQRSGVPDYVDTGFVLATLDDPSRRWTWREALDRVRGEPPTGEAGQQFRYSNSNFLLLAAAIEAATGRPHADVLAGRTFGALDLSRTTYEPDSFDTTGVVRGYLEVDDGGRLVDTTDTIAFATVGADGGIVSDAAGVARFLDALLNRGELLAPESVEALTAWSDPGTDPEWASSATTAAMDGYGLGLIRWRLDEAEGWGHSGDGFGYQAHAYTFAAERTTFVLLANGASFVADAEGNLSARVDEARDRLARVALAGR